MKLIYSLLLIFCGLVLTNAQKTYTVEGTVQDFHDKSMLENAVVKIGTFTAKTDKAGKFLFNKIPAGSYNLIAKHPDCHDYTENIGVSQDLHLTIILEHHIQDIETVTIHGSHKNNGSMVVKTLDKTVLTRNATENLGNLLTNISGVNVLKTGNNIAKPIIHGLYGSRVAILNDGVKLAEQEWGVEHAPNVDVNNFEHIDVIKGASALKYGNGAIGGVVLLQPQILPKKDTIMGSVLLSGISNGRGANLNVKLVKTWENGWAVKTNGSFKKLGDLDAPDYGLMNTGVQNSGFNFGVQKLTFNKGISFDYYLTNNSIGILRSSHVGSADDLDEALSNQEPLYKRPFSYDIDNPRQEIEHHIAKISAYQRFKDFGKITATYSFQYNHRKEYDIRRTEELSKKPGLDLELITNDININHFIERTKWNLETGINGGYQNNYSNPDTEARRLVPNYDRFYAGVYSVFKYKVLPELDIEAGARYDFDRYEVTKWYDLSKWNKLYAADYSNFVVRINQNRILTKPELNFNNISANAGITYHPSDSFNLRFNYARVSRSPNVAELFADGLHHSAAIIERGDMRIKSETGNQFNLIADAKLNVLGGLSLSVNPYFFYTKNFINEIPTGYQNTQWGGDFVVYEYQQIDARMYGVDVDVALKINDHLGYKGSASYVYGQDITNDVPLIMMMPPNFNNSVEFNKKEWNNFYFNVSNNTVLKQTRFPIYNFPITKYDTDGNPYKKEVDVSTPPAAYSLWNLQAGVNLSKNFGVDFSVRNVFDRAYRDYLNRLRFFSSEMGRNFILTLRYQF
ncbi:TonB-dependent receptor [Chryseobacterium sp. T16E-39]|uniref:TonB-dependent receptor n=1 Tax=Chryseobacterium sp. T16E-39 TaxID=2015076 RepID=UPI000B5B2966|nr:TonB-dependent receptor [Chryseobacterium sp. T16E-39]ASK30467.1 TonB-dependent receptor [Chryseobacterium sp. T16E-39]